MGAVSRHQYTIPWRSSLFELRLHRPHVITPTALSLMLLCICFTGTAAPYIHEAHLSSTRKALHFPAPTVKRDSSRSVTSIRAPRSWSTSLTALVLSSLCVANQKSAALLTQLFWATSSPRDTRERVGITQPLASVLPLTGRITHSREAGWSSVECEVSQSRAEVRAGSYLTVP